MRDGDAQRRRMVQVQDLCGNCDRAGHHIGRIVSFS